MEEPFWRKLLLSAWEIWERFFAKLQHIESIRPGGLFRLNVRRYRGPTVNLSDGTTIRPGDLVGELHLSNRETLRLQQNCSSLIRATMAVKKELKLDLVYLAGLVATGQDTPDVPAYHSITLLHHGTRSLGFEVREFQSGRVLGWLYLIGERLLLSLYHPAGIHRFQQGHQELTPKYIWLSRAALLRDYLPAN